MTRSYTTAYTIMFPVRFLLRSKKKSGELWSTNYKDLDVSLDPLKCTYLGYYISALRGCCALKFLHALEIDKALVAHTQRRTGVPPKNFNLEILKFGLEFSVLPSITSGLLGVSSQNIFQSTCRKTGLINWDAFFHNTISTE